MTEIISHLNPISCPIFWDHYSNKHDLTKNHDLIKFADFDLESKANKMLLPTKKGVDLSTTKRSIHDGRHIELVSENLAEQWIIM